MRIIIPNIPRSATKSDVKDMVENILSTRLRFPFSASPTVRYCKILSIEALTGQQNNHGLVKIYPPRAAKWLIRNVQANTKYLHKKKIEAHEYVTRSLAITLPANQERRRDNLNIKVVMAPLLTTTTPSKLPPEWII